MRRRATLANNNLKIYNSTEIAAHYAGLSQITPCEHLLFQKYVRDGAVVLDLGVGGGRTTPYLSSRSSAYLALDYAPEMVRICRAKFPNLEFKVGDASDLSEIGSHSFDAVVAAFNVLDYVIGAERRESCWRECYRVLKPEGVLVFSSHNPRAVVVRPAWNHERVRRIATIIAPAEGLIGRLLYFVLNCIAAVAATMRAASHTLRRLLRQSRYRAFWRGEGHVLDPAHGGLYTHCWVPKQVVAEVTGSGFCVLETVASDYPRASGQYVTDWYYYVFCKPQE
jgi:ubiquinone/menaquinone biosynthesis C-methylase UbiE